ncbi:DNA repair protein [Streptococcus anginosus]|uniref:DNA repair protein n=1 Tax=Streptococcus anginosus TaxID=1328 RepID=UPI003CFA2F82
MEQKELRKLRRVDLLELLVTQAKENEQLRQQVQKLQAELDSRKILVEKAGSIADASIALNKLFETAQATADQYLENIKRMEQELSQQQSAQATKIDENK